MYVCMFVHIYVCIKAWSSCAYACISIAYVYYTIIGKPIKKNESKVENNVLIKLAGMLRSKISKLIEIRRVPKIIFKFDESIEYSENIDKLLKNIK